MQQQGAQLGSLAALLATVGAPKRRAVMQHLTKALAPIMEKGILHPPMTHRCAPALRTRLPIRPCSFPSPPPPARRKRPPRSATPRRAQAPFALAHARLWCMARLTAWPWLIVARRCSPGAWPRRLLREFLESAPALSVEDAVDTLSATGQALLRMVHTHDGAAVVCAALGYGTARDRKRIVKAIKGEAGARARALAVHAPPLSAPRLRSMWERGGRARAVLCVLCGAGHVMSMARNEWGYTVLVQALSVVDDTSLTGKVICSELKVRAPAPFATRGARTGATQRARARTHWLPQLR